MNNTKMPDKFISNQELINLLDEANNDEKLTISKIFDKNINVPYSSIKLQEMISREGGHGIANWFRGGKGTGYLDILDDVADTLDIKDRPSYSTEVIYYDEILHLKIDKDKASKQGLDYASEIEQKIIIALIKKSYEQLIKQKNDTEKKLLRLKKEKHELAFDIEHKLESENDINLFIEKEEKLNKDIEDTKKLLNEINKKIDDFDNTINEVITKFDNNLGIITGTAGIMILANLGGFATYTFLTSMMSVVSFGALSFGAYTAATSLLSIIIGPVGWAGLGLFTIFSLGKPDMAKLLPVVAIIGTIRQRIKYEKTIKIEVNATNKLKHIVDTSMGELIDNSYQKGKQDVKHSFKSLDELFNTPLPKTEEKESNVK